jgi:hypothetical protein
MNDPESQPLKTDANAINNAARAGMAINVTPFPAVDGIFFHETWRHQRMNESL